MPEDRNRLEVERIENLVVNFDWEMIKHEITDDDIIMTIKKKRVDTEIDTKIVA